MFGDELKMRLLYEYVDADQRLRCSETDAGRAKHEAVMDAIERIVRENMACLCVCQDVIAGVRTGPKVLFIRKANRDVWIAPMTRRNLGLMMQELSKLAVKSSFCVMQEGRGYESHRDRTRANVCGAVLG